jgi:hypothetical protein
VNLNLAAEHRQASREVNKLYRYLCRCARSHTHVEHITKHKYLNKKFYFVNTEILHQEKEFKSDSDFSCSKNVSACR